MRLQRLLAFRPADLRRLGGVLLALAVLLLALRLETGHRHETSKIGTSDCAICVLAEAPIEPAPPVAELALAERPADRPDAPVPAAPATPARREDDARGPPRCALS